MHLFYLVKRQFPSSQKIAQLKLNYILTQLFHDFNFGSQQNQGERVLKPLKKSVGFQEKHAIGALHRIPKDQTSDPIMCGQ
jgi:hypothetical protein